MLLAGLSLGPWARGDTVIFPVFTVATTQSYLEAQASAFQVQAGAVAETYFLPARLQSRLGHQDEAERLARQALGFDPKRAEIHSFLGRLFLGQGRLEEAAGSFRKSVEFNPKAADDYRRLGLVLDQLGDPEGARKAIAAGIDLAPTDATAQLMLGRMLLDQGETGEALSHLEKACQLDGTAVNAFYVLSQAQTKAGDKAAARETLKTFERLREQEKKNLAAQDADYDNEKEMRSIAADFHTGVSAFFFEHGRSDLAEAHLRQAVKIAPGEVENYEMLAGFYLQTGAPDQARGVYEDLVRLRPRHAAYRASLGALLARKKDDIRAVEELKKALELDPHELEALNTLARIYLRTRRELPEAVSLCRRCVSLQPTAAHYDLLAQACQLNGESDEARAASAEAVRLDPGQAAYREHYRQFNGGQ